ncbi:MAG: hypothetical protein HC821_04570 [Lewinella sp.]|nr:hypothetical protein [Lewinella sp.]
MEKVEGVYQGAAFNFREGFQSGVLRMSWGKDGSLFVGQTNRGWGSTGKDSYGLQRLVWTGRQPFEIHQILAEPDGFTLHFTQSVDKGTAQLAASYSVTSFSYKYHPVYGSPIAEQKLLAVRAIAVAADGRSARLVVDGLRPGYVHEIKAEGVRAYAADHALLHPVGYYTLNRIPKGDTLVYTAAQLLASHPAEVKAEPALGHNHTEMTARAVSEAATKSQR